MTVRESDSFYDIFFIYHPDDIDFLRRAAAQLRALGVICRLDETVVSKNAVDIRQLQSDLLRSYTVAIVLSPFSAASQLCNELIQHGVNNSKRLITLVLDEDIELEVHPAIAENPFVFFREQDEFLDRIAEFRRYLLVDQETKLHTDFLVAADRWQRRGRTPDLLLPADRLEEARNWLATAGVRLPKPSPLQVEYIHSSRRKRQTSGRPIASYLGLAAIVVILGAVGIVLLQAAVGGYRTAQAAAAQTSAAQTQMALTAVAATAASDSALGLVDVIAATSVSIAESVSLTEQAQAVAATQSARATQTAQYAADRRATLARATQVYEQARAEGANRLIQGAEAAIIAGDNELALALAWEAKDRLDEPAAAIRLLRRASETHNTMAIADVAIMRLQPHGDQFALVRKSSNSVQVYSAVSWGLLHEWTDHTQPITATTYSHDGQYLITGAADGEAVIRSGDTGEPLHRLQRHQGGISAIAFHSAEDILVTAGSSPTLVTWDAVSGEELNAYEPDGDQAVEISELLVTADGGRIIGWSNENGKRIMSQWSAESLELLSEATESLVYRGTDAAGRIGYSGGRSLPAYPGDPSTGDLVFWDLASGEELSRLTEGFNWSILGGGDLTRATDELRFISFQNEIALLLVRSSDGAQRVVLVDVDDGVVLQSLENEIVDRLTTGAFLNDGTIVSATDDNGLLLWSLEDGSLIHEIGTVPEALAEMDASGAGNTAAGRTADGAVYLWRLSPPSVEPLAILTDAKPGAGLSPNGHTLLLVEEKGVTLRNIATGESTLQVEGGPAKRAGSTLAVNSGDSLDIYHAETGELMRSWQVEWESLREIFSAADGKTVLAADEDGMWLMQSDSDRPQRLSAGGLDSPYTVIFAPEGDRFLTMHADRAALWDGASGEALGAYPVGQAPGSQLEAVFSADGETLFFYVQLEGALAGLTVIELEDNSFRRHTFVDAARGEFTDDGKYLLLARPDGRILVIETENGAALYQLAGHGQPANTLHYLPQRGLLVATAALDLIIWDVESGEIDQRFSHTFPIVDVSASADGRRVLTLDTGGTYRLWQLETAEETLARIATAAAPRTLSCAEREQYLVTPLCE